MNAKHRASMFCLIAVLAFVPSALAQDQQPVQSPAAKAAPAVAPAQSPEHPMTEDQVRTYLKVTHYASANRSAAHDAMEAQRKQLPPWYPQSVWDDIEEAIDNIDPAEVLTPVYEKYISREDAGWLIRVSATPQMQKVIQSMLASDIKQQQAGAAPMEARDETMRRLATDERAEVERIVTSMTPSQQKEMQSHAAALQAMQPMLAQLRKACAEATLRKQSEVAAEVVKSHEFELTAAKKQYDDDQAQNSQSNSPH